MYYFLPVAFFTGIFFCVEGFVRRYSVDLLDTFIHNVRRGDNESGDECVWASTSSGED